MVEENEELVEQWWFKVYAKGKEADLSLWLCQRRLKCQYTLPLQQTFDKLRVLSYT